MDFCKIHTFFLVFCAGFVAVIRTQSNEFEAIHNVSSSLNQFALTLLSESSDAVGESFNLAISPYTIWSLLAIIAEGAQENTARQLEDVLKIPPNDNKDDFRNNYRSLTKYLLQPAKDLALELSSTIFSAEHQLLKRKYQATVKKYYGADVVPTNFNEVTKATNEINGFVANATRNRIQHLIQPDDVKDAQVLLVSTLFFKGQWKFPFNKTATFTDTFFDASGQAKGEVKMMYQVGAFPYSIINSLKAHAVELPYGEGNRLSMIVILPRKGEKVANLLKQLANIPFSTILDALATAETQYGDEDIQVYLPRFTISSELIMNAMLDNMGIKDLFNSNNANLLGMFYHYLYVTRVIQQAKIEVNEEGTVATAAAGASFAYKSPPPKFYANRDFVYMIVDKPTKSIIFAGKVSDPNTI